MPNHRFLCWTSLAVALALLSSACGSARAPTPIRIGALFPLKGPLATLAGEEYRGITIARDLVNADGGIGGRSIELDGRELNVPVGATEAVRSLKADGVGVIMGTYSSALSVPASAAAAKAGVTYWEAGAVADRVTGRGLPAVFRVGATGSNLGSNSAHFAAEQLAPRLGKPVQDVRVSVVLEDDDYGRSVADSAIATARAASLQVVGRTTYNAYSPDWPRVLSQVAAEHPDVLVLASYIPDGEGFRRAMLADHLHVGALIGSTMAECGPDFGKDLGPDALGVFASDRPTQGFNPAVLGPEARDAYARFAAAWQAQTSGKPTEEGLAGFTAGWALFRHVLPTAHDMGPGAIAAAARATSLPPGGLPNGGGLEFAPSGDRQGQNLLAAAVIWQWQAVRKSVTVWPPVYATGGIAMVPLPA